MPWPPQSRASASSAVASCAYTMRLGFSVEPCAIEVGVRPAGAGTTPLSMPSSVMSIIAGAVVAKALSARNCR